MEATPVYLALGANLGDRAANLRSAIQALAPHVHVERASALYETEPAYFTNQPRFLNAVLRGTTALSPLALLDALKQIERDLGRVATVRNGPRLIDLDILIYGDVVVHDQRLTIPHPRIAERPFVLVPLAEIAPDLVLPGSTVSIRALAASVHGYGDVLARIGTLE